MQHMYGFINHNLKYNETSHNMGGGDCCCWTFSEPDELPISGNPLVVIPKISCASGCTGSPNPSNRINNNNKQIF